MNLTKQNVASPTTYWHTICEAFFFPCFGQCRRYGEHHEFRIPNAQARLLYAVLYSSFPLGFQYSDFVRLDSPSMVVFTVIAAISAVPGKCDE
jgi:hypothetical protein